jgi:hypothetical protein
MQLNTLMTDPGENGFYDPTFLGAVVYTSRNYLLQQASFLVPIDPHLAQKYQGDFWGLLDELQVPKQYHPIITVLNGFTSPGDFTAEMLQLQIPDTAELDRMQKTYSTR